MEKRKCSKCNLTKTLNEYDFIKRIRKYKNFCKNCRRERDRKYYHKTKNKNSINKTKKRKEYVKSYYQKNKERIKEKSLSYYRSNLELVQEKNKKYRKENEKKIKDQKAKHYEKNKEKLKEKSKKYRKENPEKVREMERKKRARRRKEDPGYRILYNCRKRVYDALKGVGSKSARTMVLVGCAIPEYMKYLESKFQKGMSWENYGFYGWHIDHIKPCCSFDLTDPEQQQKCFHYTNTQPLWAKDNWKKGNKIIED